MNLLLLPAHGLGGAQDLPISRSLAILGAAAAVAVSFVVLVLAWRNPRYDAATSGRPAPAWLARIVDSVVYRGLLRLVGLLGLIYLVVVAVRGNRYRVDGGHDHPRLRREIAAR